MNVKHIHEADTAVDYHTLQLTSPAFEPNGIIPAKYTCDGQNINPAMNIDAIPREAISLAIIVDDPDAPNGNFCHWVIWNIPITHQVKEKENRGAQGMNDFSRHQYDGPCPRSGIHRYYFKVYALDCTLNIPVSSNQFHLEQAMSNHIIGFGFLLGKYGRDR